LRIRSMVKEQSIVLGSGWRIHKDRDWYSGYSNPRTALVLRLCHAAHICVLPATQRSALNCV
ncbi:MAG TPA: hypothetical protein VGJ51_15990, partial [Candidatus Angelobacter sp.]